MHSGIQPKIKLSGPPLPSVLARIIAANGAHLSEVTKNTCVQCHLLKRKGDHTGVQIVIPQARTELLSHQDSQWLQTVDAAEYL